MPNFVKAAKVSEMRPNEGKFFELDGRTFALFLVEGKYYCVDNTCLHRGGPIWEGFLDGAVVACPWHGWQYDLDTGQCKGRPSAKLVTYEVRVEGDDILIGT